MKFFTTIFILATAAFAAANPVNQGEALLEERQCIPNGGDCGNNPTGCCSSCCNFGRTGGFCKGMSLTLGFLCHLGALVLTTTIAC